MPSCDRCGHDLAGVFTMSFFNTDTICMDCEEKEKNHPKYREARDAEEAAVAKGDLNFPGIGKPDDL